MYGTVARIKIKPELRDEAIDFLQRPEDPEDNPGAVSFYLFQMDADPNEFYMVAVFEDKEKYVANANDPQTDAQYQEMAKFFAEEPQWHDGEIIYSQMSV